uniref:TPX2 C-terminal domain-containing protein n=1 Tax=Setaria digitata TaxID=48799 RepID=A0A915PLC6_9BILA
MSDSWSRKEQSHVYIYLQVTKISDNDKLLQAVIAIVVASWLVTVCALRKGERKDLMKASNIVSMPEVRKFKLDFSEKQQQQEVDVDLDAALDDMRNNAAVTTNKLPKKNGVVEKLNKSTRPRARALEKIEERGERCKETEREEATQSSFQKQGMTNRSQSDSRIAKNSQEIAEGNSKCQEEVD